MLRELKAVHGSNAMYSGYPFQVSEGPISSLIDAQSNWMGVTQLME